MEAEELLQRIQQLTDELERVSDPNARAVGEQLVAAVIDMHGEGLQRIFEALEEEGAATAAVRERLTGDGVVASLMLIHGLYPVDLETRVR